MGILKQLLGKDEQHHLSWRDALSVYGQPRVLTMLFLGFSAGLPFLLVFSTLIVWLKKVNVDVAVVGYFSWVGITYSIKVFWAPVVDYFRIPVLTAWLGHRRSWILVAQCGIALGLVAMAMNNPALHPLEMAGFALLVAFSSATQDISIDAFRIESADKEYQAAMASTYILGYRLAILVSAAGALYIAQYASWTVSYLVMALCVGIGVITVFVISEPQLKSKSRKLMSTRLVIQYFDSFPWVFKIIVVIGIAIFVVMFVTIAEFFVFIFPLILTSSFLSLLDVRLLDLAVLIEWRHYMFAVMIFIACGLVGMSITLQRRAIFKLVNDWFVGAIIGPFMDFFHRFGFITALLVLGLISIYRISDIFMGSMAYALYVDLGFELKEIANITKVFGVIMTLVGAALGGILVMRFGIMRPLMLGAIMVAVTNLLFSLLSTVGNDVVWLALVIAADNISGGLAQSSFIAFLSAHVNKSYTATQYALFSSLMTLLGKYLSGFSGEIVKADGYFNFFIYASIIGIPAILLIMSLIIMKHSPEPVEQVEDSEKDNKNSD